ELAHIRESGAAMDREENELGVSCIAVPVFDIHGRVPYAVSISLSTSRLKQVGEKNLNQHQPAKQTLASGWTLFFLRHLVLFFSHHFFPHFVAS
ncbi:IclR family transcriptional regulator C-terminal domain-containing protein, partial [Enterobacter hormaechei subsp. steigerwaltii]|nr:IclR family transcriptional regulator C-terminal domain-containing protein [Enterobacter hormaechei subsp. steigerwaltii]